MVEKLAELSVGLKEHLWVDLMVDCLVEKMEVLLAEMKVASLVIP